MQNPFAFVAQNAITNPLSLPMERILFIRKTMKGKYALEIFDTKNGNSIGAYTRDHQHDSFVDAVTDCVSEYIYRYTHSKQFADDVLKSLEKSMAI